jgi:hypothetical protein
METWTTPPEAGGLPCSQQVIVILWESAMSAVLRAVRPRPYVEPVPAQAPGPLRPDWLAEAARLSGKSLHLGLALSCLAARRRAPGVPLTRRTLAQWSISRDACYDGLRRLEAAGLVQVWRLPGRSPRVILLEPGRDRPLDVGATSRSPAN